MKIKIQKDKFKFITDDSRLLDKETLFLLTKHNKKYFNFKNEYITPSELFNFWNLKKLKIIGITGTNGKTSISNMIAETLANFNKKVALAGTEGIFLISNKKRKKIFPKNRTTPEILETLSFMKTASDNGAEYYVMEVSSHGIAQGRIKGINFEIKIFSNLSQDHLDFHKNMENYAKTKSSFFQDETKKIINIDDKWIKYNPKNLFSYSLKNKKADLFAKIKKDSDNLTADIFYLKNKYPFKSNLIGDFNLYNFLASTGALLKLNFKMNDILEKLSRFKSVPGRMEIIFQNENIKILTDFAHTPDAIEKVLKSIKNNGKIYTILGAGGDRDKEKRPIMAENACENSDFVFFTSDNPRNEDPEKILNDMTKNLKHKNWTKITDRKKAVKKAIEEIFNKKDKAILILLGKGDENYIEIKNKKIKYSDREEVLKNLKNLIKN